MALVAFDRSMAEKKDRICSDEREPDHRSAG